MDYLSSSSSSIFDSLCSQNIDEILHDISDFVPQTQLELGGDQILPTFQPKIDNHHDVLTISQIPPTFKDPPLLSNHIARPQKRSLLASHSTEVNRGPTNQPINQSLSPTGGVNQVNDIDSNEGKKRQKMTHKEIERQRRLEMSSLHTSLKSLLPLEYSKGKRSISDHLVEAVKYIKQMQLKIQALNDKKDALMKEVEVPKLKAKDHHEVIVNVFKGCLIEVIVITCCKDDGCDQGLPLSKVLHCMIQQGLDVVNSISKRVNNNLVHSIHAQVSDENNIAINTAILKEKLANIQN